MFYEYQLNWRRKLPLASDTHTHMEENTHVHVIKLNLQLEKKAFLSTRNSGFKIIKIKNC